MQLWLFYTAWVVLRGCLCTPVDGKVPLVRPHLAVGWVAPVCADDQLVRPQVASRLFIRSCRGLCGSVLLLRNGSTHEFRDHTLPPVYVILIVSLPLARQILGSFFIGCTDSLDADRMAVRNAESIMNLLVAVQGWLLTAGDAGLSPFSILLFPAVPFSTFPASRLMGSGSGVFLSSSTSESCLTPAPHHTISILQDLITSQLSACFTRKDACPA